MGHPAMSCDDGNVGDPLSPCHSEQAGAYATAREEPRGCLRRKYSLREFPRKTILPRVSCGWFLFSRFPAISCNLSRPSPA